MISATLLVIALAAASVNGAVQIDDTLERRIVLGEGGWALSATSCPSGSSVITDNGFEGCCPTTYQHDGHACCPSGISAAAFDVRRMTDPLDRLQLRQYFGRDPVLR